MVDTEDENIAKETTIHKAVIMLVKIEEMFLKTDNPSSLQDKEIHLMYIDILQNALHANLYFIGLRIVQTEIKNRSQVTKTRLFCSMKKHKVATSKHFWEKHSTKLS